MKNNVRKLTFCAVLAAVALILFVVEAQIPPLTAIPGIKPGLSNIVTVFALFALGWSWALAILFVRILVGTMLVGQFMSFMYSLAGGLLAFLLACLIRRFFSEKQMWIVSVLSAIMHNIGQLAVAIVLTGTKEILFYLPVLLLSGIITGAFTGLCAQVLLNRLRSVGIMKYFNR